MRAVKVGQKWVGDGHPCYISLEAGATHDGLETARKLVKAAADGGADCVKFQTIIVDEIMSPEAHSLQIDFTTPTGKKQESIYEALKRRQLTFDEWKTIRNYCRELNIAFISTPSGPQSVDWLVELKADALKVAKSDINNFFLIEYMAKTGLPVILDARERFQDVDRAMRICEKHNNPNVIIMHCPSGYPAEFSGIHLSVIPFIKQNFQVPVAYSDHSVGEIMCHAAIGLGVNFLEKTITLDRSTEAVEHFMSLEPQEIASFVKNIREIEQAMGDTRIVFNSRVKSDVRRSIFTSCDVKAGEKFSLNNMKFLRPGTGVSVEVYEELIGKVATRDLKANTMLSPTDFR
jgi:N,N'-diacetyllegionaminate synthase